LRPEFHCKKEEFEQIKVRIRIAVTEKEINLFFNALAILKMNKKPAHYETDFLTLFFLLS